MGKRFEARLKSGDLENDRLLANFVLAGLAFKTFIYLQIVCVKFPANAFKPFNVTCFWKVSNAAFCLLFVLFCMDWAGEWTGDSART